MELNRYADVHPNWEIIESLDRRQAEAVLDLLTTATMVDGDLTDFEAAALAEELVELPFVGVDREALLDDQLDKTIARVRTFDQSPERFHEFIDEVCSPITSEDVLKAAWDSHERIRDEAAGRRPHAPTGPRRQLGETAIIETVSEPLSAAGLVRWSGRSTSVAIGRWNVSK